MQLNSEDITKIEQLERTQAELKFIKAQELKLRKEVAIAVMGRKQMIPEKKSVKISGFTVDCEYKEVLKIADPDHLAEFFEDDDLPEGTVEMKPHTTLAKIKKVDEHHPIMDAVYIDVSPTPAVKVTSE